MPKELEPYMHVLEERSVEFDFIFTVVDCENSKQARRNLRIQVYERRPAKNNTSMYEFSTPFPPLKIWGIPATCALNPSAVKRFPAFPLKINMDNVIELLSEYLSRQKERKKKLLPFASVPVLRQSFIVSGTENCVDICFVSPNLFWVNNGHNLILTNKRGDVLHRVNSSHSCTSNMSELVYIDRDFSIQKLSHHTKESCPLIRRPFSWLPISIHCCQSTGDLLVGMISSFPNPLKAKVVRHNHLGAFEQSIYQNREGRVLYNYPRYITENINQDIVVSDVKRGRIVVTTLKGEFRYFASVDNPRGICTDRFSRILVCRYSKDILVLNENGMFLFDIKLKESPGIVRTKFEKMQYMFSKTIRPVRSQAKRKAVSLSYDDNTDILWVGSNDSNTISGYRIFHRKGMSIQRYLQMPR